MEMNIEKLVRLARESLENNGTFNLHFNGHSPVVITKEQAKARAERLAEELGAEKHFYEYAGREYFAINMGNKIRISFNYADDEWIAKYGPVMEEDLDLSGTDYTEEELEILNEDRRSEEYISSFGLKKGEGI